MFNPFCWHVTFEEILRTIQLFLQNSISDMYVLITYDVETSTLEGRRRLRHVARCCQNYGQRVQNSVFECELPESMFIQLRKQLTSIINSEKDSIRIYRLGKNYKSKIEHIGVDSSFDMSGMLIV